MMFFLVSLGINKLFQKEKGIAPINGADFMTSHSSRSGIIAVLMATVVLGIIVSYGWALFSVQLEQAGVATDWIGYAGTAQLLAILLNTLLLPRFLYRTNAVRLHMAASALGITAFLCLGLAGSVLQWHIPLRFVLGLGVNGCFILYEYWLNSTVEDKHRGKVMALYCTCVVLGMSIGPQLVPLMQDMPQYYSLAGAALFALALALVLPMRRHAPQAHAAPPSASPLGIILLSPAVGVIALMFGLTESTYWSFMTIYGMREGLDVADATFLLSLISIGGLVAQLPLGWLADKTSPRFTVLLATGVGAGGAFLLPALIGGAGLPLWIYMFFWGGMLTTIYTCAIIVIGHEHKAANLANATLAFQMMYGLGNIVGPATTGNAIEIFGTTAVPAMMGLACGVSFVFTAWRTIRRKNG